MKTVGGFLTIWKGMMARCYNKNHVAYSYYGGSGITVCPRWHDFTLFTEDMFPSFKSNLTLDRIEGKGNYEPSNCRWITLKEQSRNKKTNIFYEYNGKRMVGPDWAKEYGIPKETLFHRLKKGMDIHTALTTPVMQRKSFNAGTLICLFCKKEVPRKRKLQMFCSSDHLKLYYSYINFKQVNITVEEFVKNGGELSNGRDIYNSKGIKEFEYIEEKHNIEFLIHNGYFVQINAKPLYR